MPNLNLLYILPLYVLVIHIATVIAVYISKSKIFAALYHPETATREL